MTSGKTNPLMISALTATCAAGKGKAEILNALQTEKSGLRPNDFMDSADLSTWIGRVDGVESFDFPEKLGDFDCRNNRLALMALTQDDFLSQARLLTQQFGAERVGVFIGTSTSGILQTEMAYRELSDNDGQLPSWYHYQETHNNFSASEFIRLVTGAKGPALTVSTACSSSAKVFANAMRYIDLGICDAAIVGGVDSLCLTTLYGFHALQVVSESRCKPCDEHRSGINIGEAAAFAFVSQTSTNYSSDIAVLGVGESSDAYHMSSPHPEGHGAEAAMASALAMAGLTPEVIDYVNLHGTGTKANDAAECAAVARLLGGSVPCSSTKAWMGHTLGAAGALELCIAYLAIAHQLMPGNLNLEQLDPNLQCNILRQTQTVSGLTTVLSNSFGFGGSNCSVILGGRVA